ncbi:lytic murein transglycosylase [Micromonospora sp. NPDC048063]|uniref:lytic transglycosylase domain-containing protein n=1 Tax=Micromonospora sp. NPDC048063 TaxID=3364256 RepID=UPI00371D0CA1
MGDTQLVVDGEDRSTHRPLRPAVPPDGPPAGSGVAPGSSARLPRPRRPWLRSEAPAGADTPTTAPAEPAPTPTGPSATPAAPSAPDVPSAAAAPAAAGKPSADTEPPAAAKPGAAAGTSTADTKPTDTSAADTKPSSTSTADTKAAGTSTADTEPAGTSTADTKPGDPGSGAGGGSAVATSAEKSDLAATKVDVLTNGPAARARRRRVPFAHAVRLPPPRQAAAAAVRATRDWSRRPSGQLTLPGVFLLALVAATAAAGALLVPATVRAPRPVADAASVAPTAGPQEPLPNGLPLPTQTVPPLGTVPTGPAVGGVTTGRPSDALAGWAAQVGPKVGISPVAMQAYGYAELVLAQTNRSCGLSWTTLAAIGFVESGHGQANNARLGQDGKALPEIIGLPLDGQGNRMRIPDTDGGRLDKDTTFDRAIGPMQFIPTTWQEIGADADNDGVKDPHDLDDAALAAGNYLCKGSRNLTIPADWWNAILSYNDVRQYAQDVFDTANRYGQASRT